MNADDSQIDRNRVVSQTISHMCQKENSLFYTNFHRHLPSGLNVKKKKIVFINLMYALWCSHGGCEFDSDPRFLNPLHICTFATG